MVTLQIQTYASAWHIKGIYSEILGYNLFYLFSKWPHPRVTSFLANVCFLQWDFRDFLRKIFGSIAQTVTSVAWLEHGSLNAEHGFWLECHWNMVSQTQAVALNTAQVEDRDDHLS